MFDIIFDAFIDSIKTLPFLLAAYLFIEYLEHKSSKKLISALQRMKGAGPIAGAALGCVPQCGFSVASANLYAGRLISAGTLIAVFISTSDEALPILISYPGFAAKLLPLVGLKILIALSGGFAVDLILRPVPSRKETAPFVDLCRNCNCEKNGVLLSALRHTLSIFIFIFVINIVLGLGVTYVGEDRIARFLLKGSLAQPFLSALIGLIPNCAASVILTQLYVAGGMTFGSLVSGLCTGAGLGIAVLFRTNKYMKENMLIIAALYMISVISGIIINLLM